MGLLQEFREFAVKGNMVDMAVGIIIGGAFGKIVSSLVGDVLMPPLGLAVGGVDFKELRLPLKAAAGETPAVTLNYGQFVQTAFDFLIVAAAMFVVVKGVNALKRQPPPAPVAPPPPTTQEALLVEIRDILRTR